MNSKSERSIKLFSTIASMLKESALEHDKRAVYWPLTAPFSIPSNGVYRGS